MSNIDPTTQPDAMPTYIAAALRWAASGISGWLAGTAASHWLVAHGILSNTDETNLVLAGVLGAGALAWSFIQKANAHKALKAAIAAPAK